MTKFTETELAEAVGTDKIPAASAGGLKGHHSLATIADYVSSLGGGGGAVSSVDGKTGAVDLSEDYQPLSATLTNLSAASNAGVAFAVAADVAAQTDLLNTVTPTTKGLAPASGGGTTNFLRADGAWAAPPSGGGGGSGTVTSVALSAPSSLTVSGSPVTTSGTLAIAHASGYQGYTTAEATKLAAIEAEADVTDAANVSAAGAIMDGDITSNGLMVRTAAGAYTARTVAAGSGITVTNDSGVSGNPTVALSSAAQTSLGKADTAVQPAAIGTSVQAHATSLDTLAGLTSADGNIIVGDGTSWTVENGATARASLGLAIGTNVQAYDADTLKADTADVLTAGYAATPYNAGTKATGTYTPDEANGNMQYAINGGAHTLAPPVNNCTLVIQYTNNASAGAITVTGFTKADTAALTTTDGDDFFFYVTKLGGFSHLQVVALQ